MESNNFLNYTLILCFVFLIILYIKQNTQSFKNNKNNNNKNNNNKNNKNNNNKNNNNKNNNNKNNTNNQHHKKQLCSTKRGNDLVEFTNGKVCLGPSRNFHQNFNNNNDGKYLGWRNWWNKNVRKEEIVTANNEHPLMASFFKNQDNTKNIYL